MTHREGDIASDSREGGGEVGGAMWLLDSGQVEILDRQPGRVQWAEHQRQSSELRESQERRISQGQER